MLNDKTKLQMIFINQSLEKPLLITTYGCVAKEYVLLVEKIPVSQVVAVHSDFVYMCR